MTLMAGTGTAEPVLFSSRTTLRVGGPVGTWVHAPSDEAVVTAVTEAERNVGTSQNRILVVGGGSNLLVSDEGWPGVVVEVATRGVDVAADVEGSMLLTAAAGETWDDVVRLAVDAGWSGIEAMSGIPGCVGATPVQNVGAYGQDVSQVVRRVRALDRRTGQIVALAPAECGFGYRTSALKAEPDRWVVLSVTLRLTPGGTGPVHYAELARALGVDPGAPAGIAEIRAAVLDLRRSKGMVLDATDHDTWSAGSFFTNPVVAPATAAAVPDACPRYPSDVGIKLSAAWLIENSGIRRGFSLTDPARAAVSGRHTLALTNRGRATAADVIELARHIRAEVEAAFGIVLQPEARLVGFSL